MSDPDHQSPINPLPPVVVALFLVIVGIEAAFTLGARGLFGGHEAIGWRLAAMQKYAFVGEIFDWMIAQGVWPFEHVMRTVSYLFVHANFTHAAFSGVLLLAMGKMVGEVFSQWATLAVFLLSGIFGAVVFALVPEQPCTADRRLSRCLWSDRRFHLPALDQLGEIGANQARAFMLIGFLIGIQLLFGLLFGGNATWVADVAGFAVGFLMSFFLVPGGWARIRARMRRE